MSGRVVVLGATGFTGRLVVEMLLRRGIRPTIAGRRPEALDAMSASAGGLSIAVVDVQDVGSLRSVVDRGDVLVSTVGPFERLGWAAAEAAASAGAFYLDTTGEVGFVQSVRQKLDEIARRTGAALLPAFGYDFVPGIFAGSRAVQLGGGAGRRLRIGYFATGSLRRGLSSGTRATMGEGLLIPSYVHRRGELALVRTGSSTTRFRVRGRSRTAFLVSGTEVVVLPEQRSELTGVEVYNGWFPFLAPAIPAVSGVANAVARTTRGRRLVERLASPRADIPGGGPDSRERAKTLTHVVAVVDDGRGVTVGEVHVEGPSIYTLTAGLIAAGVNQFLAGASAMTGVVNPLTAFGPDGLDRVAADAGLSEVAR